MLKIVVLLEIGDYKLLESVNKIINLGGVKKVLKVMKYEGKGTENIEEGGDGVKLRVRKTI
jgi:hypothetical protein